MKSKLDTAINLASKFLHPFGRLRFIATITGYFSFFKDLTKYKKASQEKIAIADLTPMLLDKTISQPFDKQYFYQGVWAFEKIKMASPAKHVDVGAQIDLIGFLSTITFVEYIDIRVLEIDLPNYSCKKGSILQLPYNNESLRSISCLHVAEHIGLGRYGDILDPLGTVKACKELARVLAPGGNLYFSLPVGIEKVCFNAHRIHSPRTILSYFEGLELIDLSGVNDSGKFIRNISLEELERSQYAVGFFHFKK
jgi:hypothetical protein